MSELIWEEPPEAHRSPKTPSRRPLHRYAAQAAELRSRPKEWARVLDLATASLAGNAAADARKGLRGFGPAGDFDAVSRTVHTDDGPRFYVYVRYVGEEVPPEPPYYLATAVEATDWVVVHGDVMQVEDAATDGRGDVVLTMTTGRVVTLGPRDEIKVLRDEPSWTPGVGGGQ